MAKLIKLQCEYDDWTLEQKGKNYPRMRLVIDFNGFFIEQLLTHGNSGDFIDILEHQIGSRAAYEMRRLNMIRIPQDYRLNSYSSYKAEA